jgi:hypothetical protein
MQLAPLVLCPQQNAHTNVSSRSQMHYLVPSFKVRTAYPTADMVFNLNFSIVRTTLILSTCRLSCARSAVEILFALQIYLMISTLLSLPVYA